MNFFDGAEVLVTGGTGSFGREFITHILEQHDPSRVVVFSRDELKQYEMKAAFNNHDKLRFFLGDVRDRHRQLQNLRAIVCP